MGLSRVHVLPSSFECYSDQLMSPVTFLSTLETTVNGEVEQYADDVILLEELELGMVTEVSTTTEDVEDAPTEDSDVAAEYSASTAEYSDTSAEAEGDICPGILPLTVECEFNGSENETETCDLENQTYSEDDASYTADILSEAISNTCQTEVEQNHENLGSISQNCNENLNIISENLNELVAEICSDDLVFSWLSSLDGNSTMNTIDFESLVSPAAETNASDAGLAKEELRSFLLARKTKNNIVQESDNSEPRRNHHARLDDDVTRTWKRAKYSDSDPEELNRHRRRQERNRVAARKCRQKRTKLAEELTNKSEQLRRHNEQLSLEVRDLTRELRDLENYVLDHDLHMSSHQCHEQMSSLLLSQHSQLF